MLFSSPHATFLVSRVFFLNFQEGKFMLFHSKIIFFEKDLFVSWLSRVTELERKVMFVSVNFLSS